MQKIQRNPDVLWREEEGAREEALAGLDRGEDAAEVGTALLFANGQMLVLNMLGADIWQSCEGKSVDELVAGLLEEYEVEEAVLRADVTAFLAELAGKGFIRYA